MPSRRDVQQDWFEGHFPQSGAPGGLTVGVLHALLDRLKGTGLLAEPEEQILIQTKWDTLLDDAQQATFRQLLDRLAPLAVALTSQDWRPLMVAELEAQGHRNPDDVVGPWLKNKKDRKISSLAIEAVFLLCRDPSLVMPPDSEKVAKRALRPAVETQVSRLALDQRWLKLLDKVDLQMVVASVWGADAQPDDAEKLYRAADSLLRRHLRDGEHHTVNAIVTEEVLARLARTLRDPHGERRDIVDGGWRPKAQYDAYMSLLDEIQAVARYVPPQEREPSEGKKTGSGAASADEPLDNEGGPVAILPEEYPSKPFALIYAESWVHRQGAANAREHAQMALTIVWQKIQHAMLDAYLGLRPEEDWQAHWKRRTRQEIRGLGGVLGRRQRQYGHDSGEGRYERHPFDSTGAVYVPEPGNPSPVEREVLRDSVPDQVINQVLASKPEEFWHATSGQGGLEAGATLLGALAAEELGTDSDVVAVVERLITAANDDLATRVSAPLLERVKAWLVEQLPVHAVEGTAFMPRTSYRDPKNPRKPLPALWNLSERCSQDLQESGLDRSEAELAGRLALAAVSRVAKAI